MHVCWLAFAIKLDAGLLYLFFLCFLLIGFAIAAAFAEARKVKRNGFLSTVRVLLKDGSVIGSDPAVYFIGMTKAYFLIFDSKKRTCTVYKSEELKQIMF
jgi:hypothetical protein